MFLLWLLFCLGAWSIFLIILFSRTRLFFIDGCQGSHQDFHPYSMLSIPTKRREWVASVSSSVPTNYSPTLAWIIFFFADYLVARFFFGSASSSSVIFCRDRLGFAPLCSIFCDATDCMQSWYSMNFYELCACLSCFVRREEVELSIWIHNFHQITRSSLLDAYLLTDCSM